MANAWRLCGTPVVPTPRAWVDEQCNTCRSHIVYVPPAQGSGAVSHLHEEVARTAVSITSGKASTGAIVCHPQEHMMMRIYICTHTHKSQRALL